MKEQILKIAQDLEKGNITDIEAQNLLLCLFSVSGQSGQLINFFITVREQAIDSKTFTEAGNWLKRIQKLINCH
jgi:hypothetical protein